MKWISYLLVLLFSSAVVAQCPEINFYQMEPAIHDIPIVNQGDLNTCYAHSLSTAYNLQFPQSPKLNTYAIAYTHKNRWLHWTPRNLDYSILSWAYSDVTKKGVCEAEATVQKIISLKRGVNYSDEQFMYLVKSFFKWQKKRSQKTMQEILKKLNKKSDRFESEWKIEDITKILLPFYTTPFKKNFFQWLDDEIFGSCLKIYPEQKMSHAGRGDEPNKYLSSLVEKSIGQGHPVMVGYCNRIFKNPKLDLPSNPRILKAVNPLCGSHYSVLVGSRPRKNQCDYLLRNSVGEDYWAPSAYECVCENRATKAIQNCSKQSFNRQESRVLACWVPESKLLTNAFEISYYSE
jgi:hypothetical protein